MSEAILKSRMVAAHIERKWQYGYFWNGHDDIFSVYVASHNLLTLNFSHLNASHSLLFFLFVILHC